MILMGIGDEASSQLAGQIEATRELGWKFIELRSVAGPDFPKTNFHDIPDAAFDRAVAQFEAADVRVHCFGSAIMNWSKQVGDPFEITLAEVKRAIPRLQRLGTRYVRIMSYKPDDDVWRIPPEVFRRVNEVVKMFLDAGLQPLHENCMNFGGMSWRHALDLLDKCPGLQWLFDPANPIFNLDRSRPKPWPRQDPWEFWINLRDHVRHIHIKDATWNDAKKKADFQWPGEGQGRVREILADAVKRGYDGGLSLEPHMVLVFHEPPGQMASDALRKNFAEYGRRVEKLLAEAGGKRT